MITIIVRKLLYTIFYTLFLGTGPVLLTYYFTKSCNGNEECEKTRQNVLIAGIILTIMLFSLVSVFQ